MTEHALKRKLWQMFQRSKFNFRYNSIHFLAQKCNFNTIQIVDFQMLLMGRWTLLLVSLIVVSGQLG